MEIVRGVRAKPVKVLIYGPEGIGKSTLASCFPNPLFIDTEGSTDWMDVARASDTDTWQGIMDAIDHVIAHPDICDTLVIDTADKAETRCIESVLKENGKNGIEDFAYGKGYVYLTETFQKLFNKLDEVLRRGIHVVVTAHAAITRFDQPDEMGSYDRWTLKLLKRNAPLVKEWADMVLFCNYKTTVVNVDGQGETKGRNKVQGGKRVMYSTHRPCWDAKNRFGLPEEMNMSYEAIAHVIPTNVPKPEPPAKKLTRLMDEDGVSEFEIQTLAGAKGWVSEEEAVANYSEDLVTFLVKSWETVKERIREMNDSEAVPFMEGE